VAVITTGVKSVEGAVQAGMAFAIIAQILTYVPTRLSGIEFVLFAFGALNYARHPEGIVEYQKTQWMNRVARLLRRMDERRGRSPGQTGLEQGMPIPAGIGGAALPEASGA